jgi:putative ABC transport system permease protein
MIRSYIQSALRALLRNRLTSIINIGGLAAGIAASMLIMLFIFSELSVDKFNDNYESIYRLEYGDFVVTGTAQALLLKEAFPEVGQTVRMDFRYRPIASFGDDNFRFDNFVYADSTLFDVFTFEFVRGNPETALIVPFSLVLTTSEAKRFFGTEDPVGKMLTFNNIHEYTVTAVINDISDFHLPVSAIGSFSSLPYVENDDNHDRYLFNYMNFLTYVLFRENSDPGHMAQKFEELIDERFPDERRYNLRFRPLSDIYFNRAIDDSPPVRHGNLPLVYTLVAVAGFILVIAIVNFINLATANASVRSSEIGMRKIMGASRNNLIFQFLTESVIISFSAFLLGTVMVELLLPLFNSLLFTNLSFDPLQSLWFLISLMMLVLITGILAGLYPAFYLSSMKACSIVKEEFSRGRRALHFRRFLIVVQFIISIVLIISTITVYWQVEFMRHKDLGFIKENVVTLRLNRDVYTARDAFHDKLVNNDGIVSVSMSNNLPGYVTWFNTWTIGGESKPHKFLPVDPDYIGMMGIEMSSGRNFDWNRIADQRYTFVLNEEAVRYFGFEDPAGKDFMVGGLEPVRVIGVVKDFHFRSLHEPVGPLVLGWHPQSLGIANIRIKEGNTENILNMVRENWEELSPGSPFEYMFLDDEIDKLYSTEIRIGQLFRYFALLAVIIACMGLYGLSTFIAYQRTREIGIRKVLGSGISGIIVIFTSELARWVVFANIVAWPVAYLLMVRWLDNFPYRIEQSLAVYISAGLMALVIAVITVGGTAWRTACLNPALTLRNE